MSEEMEGAGRKLAEALQARERGARRRAEGGDGEALRLLFKCAPAGAAMASLGGSIIDCNGECSRRRGRVRREQAKHDEPIKI